MSECKPLFQASAPGKVILSGEHAVVYGSSALAMPINYYATTTVQENTLNKIRFIFSDFSQEKIFSFSDLIQLNKKIKKNYALFRENKLTAKDILEDALNLLPFASSLLFQNKNLFDCGVDITIQSTIPCNRGMGSSAAVIVSMLKALAQYSKLNLSVNELSELARTAENMRHGYSSGLDIAVSLRNSAIYFKSGEIAQRDFSYFNFSFIDTGEAESSTGECVTAVSSYFKNDLLIKKFTEVTNKIDDALANNNSILLKEGIRENHKLLTEIGVVPDKVQKFISEIEEKGGAAKICGAGSIKGDQGGIVWGMMEEETNLIEVIDKFQHIKMKHVNVID